MEKLQPFNPLAENISLRGELKWDSGQLRLRFEVDDPTWALKDGLQAKYWKAQELKREDGLWKSTCFEAFWGEKGRAAYWELNLSGDGKWNLYRFDGYRSPEPPVQSDDFTILELKTTNSRLDCLLKPKGTLGALEASLTAVVRVASGTHYFAVKHASAKADFHLRDSFCLHL